MSYKDTVTHEPNERRWMSALSRCPAKITLLGISGAGQDQTGGLEYQHPEIVKLCRRREAQTRSGVGENP